MAGHHRHLIEEVPERGAPAPQLFQLLPDGVNGGGAVGIGAVEGKVGLVQLSDVAALGG